MVKGAEWRKRKYEAGVNPEVIGKRFEQVKPGMVRLEGEYLPQIASVEMKVKGLVEAHGVPTFEVAQYINVGRQCYSIAKRFSQATRDQEAQRVVNKWASRGLDGPLLVLACRAGGCEVEEPAAVCYNPCPHAARHEDGGVDEVDVTGLSGVLADDQPTDAKTVLDDLLMAWKIIVLPTNAGWTPTLVGSGTAGQAPFSHELLTGVTPNSTALLQRIVFGMTGAGGLRISVDYSKRLEWYFTFARSASDAEAVTRVQLKNTSAEGALAGPGLGLEMNNFAVLGEAYGSARQTVALGNVVDDMIWWVKIVLVPGVRVEFWVNGVLTGTLTGTAVPTGTVGPSYVVHSIINGATGGVNTRLYIGDIKLVQEW